MELHDKRNTITDENGITYLKFDAVHNPNDFLFSKTTKTEKN